VESSKKRKEKHKKSAPFLYLPTRSVMEITRWVENGH
jgi:hypothetical protein